MQTPFSASCMTRRSRRMPAFTLTELLTVIAIIGVMIGILIPVTSAVRNKAKEARTRVQMNGITVACEAFKNDQNEYPQSNPAWYGVGDAAAQSAWEVKAQTGNAPLSGANLLVDCVMGRDGLGFDPKVGTGPGTTSASRYHFAATDNPPRNRKTAYLATEGVKLSDRTDRKPRDGFSEFDINEAMPIADTNDSSTGVPVFLDEFGFPILYYRANPTARPQTRIIQSASETGFDVRGTGVYDGRDNDVFTSHTVGGKTHKINQAATGLANNDYVGAGNNFATFIRSRRTSTKNGSTITFARPIKEDSFILLSPGKDGIWGNTDDLGNFESDNK